MNTKRSCLASALLLVAEESGLVAEENPVFSALPIAFPKAG